MKSREFLSLALVLVLTAPPGVAARKPPTPEQRDAKLFQSKLSKDASILLALDRLTFGPRPGDVEYVKRMGLKNWIDQQLHPERIPEDRELDAILAPLASLYMTSLEVAQHYPPPQMIKAIADGRKPMPDDPILRASIQRYIVRFRAKKDADADKSDRIDDLEPARPLDEILTPPQLVVLRSGKPEERKALLASLTPADQEDLVIAMPRPLRQQNFNVASADLRRKILQLNAPQQVVAYDLVESKLMRAIYSNRASLPRNWTISGSTISTCIYEKGSDRFLIPSYERDAIRPVRAGQIPRFAGSHG